MLKTIKQNILQWWNELDKKYFLGMLLFSSFVFFPLVSQRLTNAYDGMWTTAEYWAGGGSFPTDDGFGQCSAFYGLACSWNPSTQWCV